MIEICEGIKHLNLRITLPNAIRADLPLNRENRFKMFKSMHEAGVVNFGLGVEHGDQEFLNEVTQKRLDLDEVRASCDLAHEAGILVHANFMIGFPFETKENRDKTINFAKSLKSDSFSVSLVAPLPGTKLYDICKKHNLQFRKTFFSSYRCFTCKKLKRNSKAIRTFSNKGRKRNRNFSNLQRR